MINELKHYDKVHIEDVSLPKTANTFLKESDERPVVNENPNTLFEHIGLELKKLYLRINPPESDPVNNETMGKTINTGINLIKEVFILKALELAGVKGVPRVIDSQSGYVDRGLLPGYTFASAQLEKIEGKSLAESQLLDEETVLKIGIDTAKILGNIYNRHILHNDVKPGNIMLTENKEVIVVDFNNAKILDFENKTLTNVGTVTYSPPEKTALDGEDSQGVRYSKVDVRSDIYSLAVTLAEKAGVYIYVLSDKSILDEKKYETFLYMLEQAIEEGNITQKFAVFLQWNSHPQKQCRYPDYERFIEGLQIVGDPDKSSQDLLKHLETYTEPPVAKKDKSS
ncbi:hypothetical protein A3K34_04435 [candidate division WWE3 bacterium RIFOXYC1_FULL_40_10]|uniref:non-specific serine/threonine protein kinase n=1 Tax=candidate division WWE3 bacterium RIFOXYA2_FULL_46_9 TaxID=1802636 RepID=A0A1F4W182_UNCKA|nr:MAG: hypothetical protein A3K58_04435 [candidate division WWE3 bacterium RIFOXYB1_FULL_40_22]OGC62090.1 MAG: hypothetical protein A3K37_04435 [candidate division WWE3 bacterium RIFOXYA1_FULL_40_11]OGC63105.1 MAG: hypothetical protein A2264_00180 [candidate division WWE3 bacterium RIFOXYA2_FULL_46_9]OGC64967.1 MAG: hypothetical protein A2326_02930 [candidate division WWE3 bacterium RIFOXYB2_FULL_41_6]OGC66473.1 MAG: hypothetical protein A3K34_04435 [candidate division WWE3 bacterium RIFOXYC1_